METGKIQYAMKVFINTNDIIDLHVDLNLAHRFYGDAIFRKLVDHYLDWYRNDSLNAAIEQYYRDFDNTAYHEHFCTEWAFTQHPFAQALQA